MYTYKDRQIDRLIDSEIERQIHTYIHIYTYMVFQILKSNLIQCIGTKKVNLSQISLI